MQNILKLTYDKLNLQNVSDLINSTSYGSIFVSTGSSVHFNSINAQTERDKTIGIKGMENICSEIRKEWPDVRNIVIYCRLGDVSSKEYSVIIGISATDSITAMKATESCVSSFQTSVAIWKRELFSANQPKNKENSDQNVTHPPKRPKITINIPQKVQVNYVPPHLIQIKAKNDDLNFRIDSFQRKKRGEINQHNIKEFIRSDRDLESSCARIDAIVAKRKDSKSHLQVEKVLNSYQNRDQKSSDYLKKHIPKNGIVERLQILETQLSINKAVPLNVYQRLKQIEDRLLFLESTSPEYIQFWERTPMANKSIKKKVFLPSEIDEIIAEMERRG